MHGIACRGQPAGSQLDCQTATRTLVLNMLSCNQLLGGLFFIQRFCFVFFLSCARQERGSSGEHGILQMCMLFLQCHSTTNMYLFTYILHFVLSQSVLFVRRRGDRQQLINVSLTHSLPRPHSDTHFLTLTHSPTHPPTHAPTCAFFRSIIHLPTHLTQSTTPSLIALINHVAH